MMSGRGQRLLARLGELLEARGVRIALVTLIIVSVLPYPMIERTLRPLFLAAFGAELAVRVPLTIQRRRRREVGAVELAFLIADTAAFVSFLPLEDVLHRHLLWLTMMRMSRLLVLLRFARELAADLYSILTRREQLQQFGLVTVAVASLAFVTAVVLNQLDIPNDYDGIPESADTFWDRMWWSFRQLEDPGNLVSNLRVHPAIGVLSLALTITGVFIISFVIGIGTNVVEQVVRAERRRQVGYSGHTVVVGPIAESETFVREFVRIYSKNRSDTRDNLRKAWRFIVYGSSVPRPWRLPRMALLGPDRDPPAVLYEPGMRWVVYREGEGTDAEALARIGAPNAKRAILLGDRGAGEDADAITLATLAAFRDLNPHAHVFVELLSSRHYPTFCALRLDEAHTFPVDVPWYLGLFLLHHLLVAGVERLYGFLLTADGSEFYTHIYVDSSELEALAGQGDESGYVPFSILAELAERHDVVLAGVFLGAAQPRTSPHHLVPMEGVTAWVNPYAEPTDARLIELGARQGRVPVVNLRGLIGVAETYQPVRDLARALVAGSRPVVPELPAEAAGSILPPAAPPRCVLVIGYGDSIGSMIVRLAELSPGVRVVLACNDGEAALERLRPTLQRSGLAISSAGAALPEGGRIEVRTAKDAMEPALAALDEACVQAVVFIAEAEAPEPDARTALRMMRLAEHLLHVHQGPVPRVLAEMITQAKGERVRAQITHAFARCDREAPAVTLVSTEQIRHYFMVHSAFVPGIDDVYAGLLGAKGQDLVRLPLASPTMLRMSDARRMLAERGMVALALERADGSVCLNPKLDADCPDVRAIYAIGSRWDGRLA